LVSPETRLRAGSEVDLEPAEARHLINALRGRADQQVILADGAGVMAEATVVAIRKGRVTVSVDVVSSTSRPAGPGVILVLAVLNGQAMDWAVQKAVEVGVMRLIPVLTRRSQPSLSVARTRLSHWHRVALQAIKQCHRPWAMELDEVLSLDQLLQRYESRPGLVACAGGEPVHRLRLAADTVLLIGPEGGLSPSEMQLLGQRQWRQVSLGRYTLRSETAAAVGAAMVTAALEPGSV
jgi:16S rRNA (uracil1498-N3)-methyltransferase